ncbi:interferon-inducible GTPase 5-like [Dendronephthya gigantea]|uniref:interferon-inducible GTPase 5-like n=1 Tax=Dendronephthya gigantea TaxID=151771 RepID=UPI00106D9276|nr:interferon-inducible GTPase 5-like [Dendronephthya gigantea]
MGTSESKEDRDKECVKFALVGSSGSGKSAFVNAARGIDDDDEKGASVDIVETGKNAYEFINPENPHVSYWDTPGYGTSNYPNLQKYWKECELQKFDTFLIFISLRVTKLDLELIKKVKSAKKSFLIIRTKIDIESRLLQKRKNPVKEDEFLEKVRDYVHNKLNLDSSSKDRTYLISNYDPYKWEFFQLIQAMNKEFSLPEMATWQQFFVNRMMRSARAFKFKGIEAAQKLVKEVNKWKGVKIKVAIVGQSGCGKSSFVNAIRSVKDDDPNAAQTGVTETTIKSTPYSYPHNPNITLVDCPGIGSPDIPDVDTFCTSVKIKDFDAFIITTADRFGNIDKDLAKKFQENAKPFFFIRTKIDIDCENEKKKGNTENETLEKIKADCFVSLKSAGAPLEDNDIFLISNHDPLKWDFSRLTEALSDQLPTRIRTAFLFTMFTFSEKTLRKKVEVLKERVWMAILHSFIAQVYDNITLQHSSDFIISRIAFYRSQLGFPEEDSMEFKNFSPARQNDFRKFFIKPGVNVINWLKNFDHADFDQSHLSVNAESYRFLRRSMHHILDEMEKVAIEVMKEATNLDRF